MYKVGEVAKQLDIPKYQIFEKLISYNDILGPYVKKKNSITYIDEMGVTLIKKLIEGKFEEISHHNIMDDLLTDEPLVAEKVNQEAKEITGEEGVSESTHVTINEISEVKSMNVSAETIEAKDEELEHIIEAKSPDIDDKHMFNDLEDEQPINKEVKFNGRLPEKKGTLKISLESLFKIKNTLNDEIMELKLNLNAMDQEIRKKDSALIHYQFLLKDDIEWIEKHERKIHESGSEIYEEDEKGFLGIFKNRK